MPFTKEDIEPSGMIERDGVIICPDCLEGLRFNSGNPAVFHADKCPRGESGPTYMGPGQIRFYAAVMPDGEIEITGVK